jgi:hypothetical protein
MTPDPVQAVADAVLYEGFILYPYRPSALKNRQRWTFGGVFPQAFSVQSGSDPWRLQSECLVEGGGRTRISMRLRFLQLVVREPAKPAVGGGWTPVPVLEVEGRQVVAWEEAMEREVAVPPTSLADLAERPLRQAFAFDAAGEREEICDGEGRPAGSILRTRRRLEGTATVSATSVGPGLWRLQAAVENGSPLDQPACESRTLAQPSALASAHAILRVEGGRFISQTDPPAYLHTAAEACRNQGWWPVLAGPEGCRDTVLATPIILEDHPRIAPESPGDLFDSAEIDEILTLRILTMTDAEKAEAAAADPRAKALLDRTEALDAEAMAKLHGALRKPAWPKPELAALHDRAGDLSVGDRVRLKPRAGGDVMDIVLAGKIAVVEAIERDFEDRVHVAVTIEDDPGRDLGLDRFPGHRFFFSREELEPVALEAAP